jgi:hypothetical protein
MKRSFFASKTLLLIAVCAIASCTSVSYAKFHPSKESILNIEFEYPSSWIWEDVRPGFIGTHISDKNGFADMGIFVYKEETWEATLQHTERMIDGHFEWARNRNAIIFDISGFIDDYPARFISLELPPDPYYGETTPQIQENIYIFANDRVYFLILNIDKDQRNGAFGRGFDHVIETLRVIETQQEP